MCSADERWRQFESATRGIHGRVVARSSVLMVTMWDKTRSPVRGRKRVSPFHCCMHVIGWDEWEGAEAWRGLGEMLRSPGQAMEVRLPHQRRIRVHDGAACSAASERRLEEGG